VSRTIVSRESLRQKIPTMSSEPSKFTYDFSATTIILLLLLVLLVLLLLIIFIIILLLFLLLLLLPLLILDLSISIKINYGIVKRKCIICELLRKLRSDMREQFMYYIFTIFLLYYYIIFVIYTCLHIFASCVYGYVLCTLRVINYCCFHFSPKYHLFFRLNKNIFLEWVSNCTAIF